MTFLSLLRSKDQARCGWNLQGAQTKVALSNEGRSRIEPDVWLPDNLQENQRGAQSLLWSSVRLFLLRSKLSFELRVRVSGKFWSTSTFPLHMLPLLSNVPLLPLLTSKEWTI